MSNYLFSLIGLVRDDLMELVQLWRRWRVVNFGPEVEEEELLPVRHSSRKRWQSLMNSLAAS